jgi:hypothetical protein
VIGPKLCECGCGQPTPVAPKTSRRDGWIAGQPLRFVRGHNATADDAARARAAKGKACDCGCGLPAPIARKTDTRRGHIKGRPIRYISGHNPLDPKRCECGCGQPAPLAKETDRRRGVVQGQPRRFLPGHGGLVKAREARTRPADAQIVIREPGRTAALYAEELLHLSELVVGAVHDDGPDQLCAHIAAALRIAPPPGVDPVVALVTVLAAQIDPDTTAEQRLGWVRAFDRAAAQAPTPPRQLPVRASPRKETAA